MKPFLVLLALALSVAACNQNSKHEKSANNATPVNIKLSELATTKDLNCGMDLQQGSIADTCTYQGKIYGFCSAECKAEFLKDPQAHLTQK